MKQLHIKKKSNAIMIVLLIMLTGILFCLTGCNIFNPFIQPIMAKKELRAKYGESFSIIKTWSDRYGYKAICSPQNDESIKFFAMFYGNDKLFNVI